MNRARRLMQVVAVLLLLFTATAGATVQPAAGPEANVQGSPTSILDEIGEASSHIVSGKVAAVTSYMNDRGSISTKVTVTVDSVLKGSLADSEIVVEYEGGAIGDTTITVFWEKPLGDRFVGTRNPSFEPGDVATLHLVQDGDIFYLPYDDLGVIKSAEGEAGALDAPPGGEGYLISGLYWNYSPVNYYMNVDGTADSDGEADPDAEFDAVNHAFQTWEDDAGSYIDFEYAGTTGAGFNPFDGISNVNWSYNMNFPPYPAAMVQERSVGNWIVEADMVFNEWYNWSTAEETPAGYMDVQNMGTHEAGHYLQLLDLYDEADERQTMNGERIITAQNNRTLYWGDIAGIRSIYPHTHLAGAGLGWESQGGDLALGDVNESSTPDMVLARVNDGQPDYVFYWIGYDISSSTGQVSGWSNLAWMGPLGTNTQGLGAALAYIDGNPRPDLVFLWVDNPAGQNVAYYRVGFNIGFDGWTASWGPPVTVPIWGSETQGAGLAAADLDGNGRPEFVIDWVDNPSGDNYLNYRVLWNLDQYGNYSSLGGVGTMPYLFGTETQGAGITIINVDSEENSTLDFVMMWVDNPPGGNLIQYRIGWDVPGSGPGAGQPTSWSREFSGGWDGWVGANSQGGGISSANLDADGRPDLTVMWVDNPSGEDYLYYRQM